MSATKRELLERVDELMSELVRFCEYLVHDDDDDDDDEEDLEQEEQ